MIVLNIIKKLDNTEPVRSVHSFSLETELAQIGLCEFHVNDEEAANMVITDSSADYDSDGNFIPTTFYNPEDKRHSFLDRVLADKAPHWGIGYVTPYIALDEQSQTKLSSEFQITYTVDGESIYDFLTGTVAEESNVVLVFDTMERKINCYSLCDCIDQKSRKVITHNDEPVTGIGEDTSVFISKTKLANEITISSNKDNVKNCFRIEGGDDVITDMVIDPGEAETQYHKIVKGLTADLSFVAVSSLNNYGRNLFTGVTNNVEAYAQVFLNPRFINPENKAGRLFPVFEYTRLPNIKSL